MLLCVAAAAVAGVALLGWFVLLRPDVADIVKTFVPDVGLPLLVVGGLLFSMVNAAVEEIAYRGIMMHALEQALGRGAVALGLQALAFGTLHIHGFPRGWIGVCLATIYGLMIGVVRVRAGGIFAPWLAHVLTDMAIVGILVILVL
jgi:membrane protease YdiL (CAAX protease family)